MARGGLHAVTEQKHTVDVQLTLVEKWVKVGKLALARGEDLDSLLSNVPEEVRSSVLAAVHGEKVIDVQAEEVPEGLEDIW